MTCDRSQVCFSTGRLRELGTNATSMVARKSRATKVATGPVPAPQAALSILDYSIAYKDKPSSPFGHRTTSFGILDGDQCMLILLPWYFKTVKVLSAVRVCPLWAAFVICTCHHRSQHALHQLDPGCRTRCVSNERIPHVVDAVYVWLVLLYRVCSSDWQAPSAVPSTSKPFICRVCRTAKHDFETTIQP